MSKGTLNSKRKALLKILREGQSWDLLEAVLSNLKKAGIYIQINDFYRCDSYPTVTQEIPEGFFVRSVVKEEIPRLVPLEGKNEEVFLTRLEEYNDECRGIFLGDSLAGYVWLSDSVIRIPELEYERPLAENEIYMYDVFIGEDWRGQKLYSLFLTDLIQDLVPAGKTILTSVEFTNYRARKADQKMGFNRSGRGFLIKLGGLWEWSSIRPHR